MTRWANGDELAKQLAAEAAPASPFAEALIQTLDVAATELKQLRADNAALVQRNARLLVFVRQAAALSDPASMSKVMRLFALNDIQRAAAQLLKESGS